MSKVVTAEEALSYVKSGDRVFIHSVAAAPQLLIDSLVARKNDLRNVEIVHLHTECDAKYVEPEYEGHFRLKSFFVGANVRKATQEHRADYIPVFLSEIPKLFRENVLPLDVALVQISPPDAHGFCSLGVSVDATLAAIETAKLVIAQVNPRMPRTYGDGCVAVSHFDFLVEHESPIPVVKVSPLSEEEIRIGKHVAALVEDGATLQMGIGNIPNAVLAQLGGHKKLGIHTEMFSDGVIPLINKGVITGEKKKLNREKIVSSFVMGTDALYDFINDNPGILMMDVAYVNDVATIRQNPKVTSINSAIEIDYTGQVCADSIGTKHFSGVGGQIDFIRGASYSKGGKPIIAMTSTTKRGESKIVPFLKEGAGVVSTRPNVHYIVTEYGVANLYGKSLKERTKLMINIAHPDHREWLEKESFKRFGKI
ncbi:MAG: 4-hydroxybutyrate CoA-transferase [Cyclobacteriaceae bacterium]|nr:4-hydroxybutyrate CoA-transferase [Cyclobacteriaceae bacterium]